jgi:hypothetical protein
VNFRHHLIAFAPSPGSGSCEADQANTPTCRDAVFLHGGWRCGSTYVWSRMRECAETLCFYEPFHEVLARCTSKRIWRDTTLTWNSRHPLLKSPYRYEYLPLLRRVGRHGIRRYREEFAISEYFPSERGSHAQVAYLRQLVRHAQRVGKQPVFGFSRSLARAGVIKEALGGWHAVIRRDLRQQWLSCRSYRVGEGALYFELCYFLILALAPPQSPAGWYARFLGLPRPPAGRFRDQLRFMERALCPWTDELSYRAFVGVNLLSYEAAMCAADLIIDMDRLSRERDYRNEVSGALFSRCGLEVRFDDCHIAVHDLSGLSLDFAAVESDVRRLLRVFGTQTRPERELSPALEVP